ncbi:DUF1249 domain-containing protein [Sessilibacter sp. MAH2]
MNSVLKERRQYVVDLRAQQAECDANYHRLLKLLPTMEPKESRDYVLDGRHHHNREQVSLKVLEQAPYTSTIEFKQSEPSHGWSPNCVLRVRMYHDAKMAEVVSWDEHWNTRARYHYPNKNMYHVDEKAQLNKFLGEWLAHCLSCGRVDTQNVS